MSVNLVLRYKQYLLILAKSDLKLSDNEDTNY